MSIIMRGLGVNFDRTYEDQPLSVIANVIASVLPVMMSANSRCTNTTVISLPLMKTESMFAKRWRTLFRINVDVESERNERNRQVQIANVDVLRNLTVFEGVWQWSILVNSRRIWTWQVNWDGVSWKDEKRTHVFYYVQCEFCNEHYLWTYTF